MCGIAGYFKKDGDLGPELSAMTDAIVHRGPDAADFFADGPLQMGMRRLSINDVEGGRQPLLDESGQIVLMYNGEIYNAPALRRDLEGKGKRFRTGSDGEVICHLFFEMGIDCLQQLDGMFALALWDCRTQSLYLARDIAGEKPLYYSQQEGAWIFASEIKAMKAYEGFEGILNRQAIWDFPTFLWVPEPATIYENVQAVMPGHYLQLNEAGVSMHRYYRPDPLSLPQEEEALVAYVREQVQQAVQSRLLSDVPVGAFLSGGLDSSIVSTVAARHLPNLQTFTIAFEDVDDPYHGRADESADAAAYAAVLGTQHHTIRVEEEHFRKQLMDFSYYADQPFGVSSGLGILSIAQAAQATGVKVLLSGDAADECFGGYSWYAHLQAIADGDSQERVATDCAVSWQSVGCSQQERLQALQAMSPAQRAWAWHYYASEGDKAALFAQEAFAGCRSALRYFDREHLAAPIDFVRQDRAFYMPNEMLRKVDRMTMAHSVEGRCPFVAKSILALAEALPFEQMHRASGLKYILRQAFAQDLPRHVWQRPKHGFNVPIDHWLAGPWQDLLRHTFSRQSRLSQLGFLGKDAEEQASKLLSNGKTLHGHTLFCYIMLENWLAHHH